MSRYISTGHTEFYKATRGDEVRYYPTASAGSREQAITFDATDDPTRVMGFAVYDISISTVYAAMLFSSEAEATAYAFGDNDMPAVGTTDQFGPSDAAPEDIPVPPPADDEIKASSPRLRKPLSRR